MGDTLPPVDLMLRRLADKADRWEDTGKGTSCRKRVQVKTLADLQALGEEIAGTGHVQYKINGIDKTPDQTGGMTDASSTKSDSSSTGRMQFLAKLRQTGRSQLSSPMPATR